MNADVRCHYLEGAKRLLSFLQNEHGLASGPRATQRSQQSRNERFNGLRGVGRRTSILASLHSTTDPVLPYNVGPFVAPSCFHMGNKEAIKPEGE